MLKSQDNIKFCKLSVYVVHIYTFEVSPTPTDLLLFTRNKCKVMDGEQRCERGGSEKERETETKKNHFD